MRSRHIAASAAVIAALGGSTAAAVAATSGDDRKAAESTVLADAAKKLGVSSDDLRSALAGAEDAQIDAQVKAGKLTQAQADAIKARRAADGTVLGVGGGHGGRGGHAGGRLADDAAKAIGITTTSLFDQLRSGKTLEDIAKAKGKTLDEVKAAVKTSATAELKADLDAKRITQAQYDEQASDLDDAIADLASGKLGHGGGRGDHDGGPGAPSSTAPSTTTTP
jgi:hypothetical protein